MMVDYGLLYVTWTGRSLVTYTTRRLLQIICAGRLAWTDIRVSLGSEPMPCVFCSRDQVLFA